MTADLPLVSIIVITYNSSKYVLETLESAKAQTYQNIELIISDDGSTDKTIEICENWLAENKERFVHSQIITVEKNTGIPANCNRGVKASKGEWLKLIAGDDILLEDCVQLNINFNVENRNLISVSNMICVSGYENRKHSSGEKFKKFFNTSTNQFLMYIRYPLFLNTPSLFYHREVYNKVNGFDERIKILEDIPFFVKVLRNNYHIAFNPSFTVKYRLHQESLSNKDNINLNDALKSTFYLFRKDYLNNGSLLNYIFMKNAEYSYKLNSKPGFNVVRILYNRYYKLFLRMFY